MIPLNEVPIINIHRDNKQDRGYQCWGEERMKSNCLTGTLFGVMKNSGNGKWWWLHSIVNVL